MDKLTIKVHPLFMILGIYFALTGKVFSFAAYTLCACIHELGHSLMAERFGYKLKKITLMPFGAIVSGDMSGMSLTEECFVALAGPCVNFIIGMFVVGVWWVFPESYPYTEIAAEANFALCLINLIPAFPLDGGRLTLCLLSKFLKRTKAVKIAKLISYALAAALVGIFIYSCFVAVNFSVFILAIFIVLGAMDKKSADAYVRIFDCLSVDKINDVKTIKEIAISETLTVRKLYRKLTDACLYRVRVYSESGELKRTIEPNELADYLAERRLDMRVI